MHVLLEEKNEYCHVHSSVTTQASGAELYSHHLVSDLRPIKDVSRIVSQFHLAVNCE